MVADQLTGQATCPLRSMDKKIYFIVLLVKNFVCLVVQQQGNHKVHKEAALSTQGMFR